MRTRFGVKGRRLRELEADLEPLFRLAVVPIWPDGTDVHDVAPRPRKATDKTPAVPEMRPPPFQPPDPPVVREVGETSVGERYHDHIVSVLGYTAFVEIGSLLGSVVLDALFSNAPYGMESYNFLQYLALYRTAAAAAGLDTEGALIAKFIHRFFHEAEAWNEVGDLDIIEEAPAE